MEVFEYRIIKIEKGVFFIEYKTARFDSWKEIDKPFKTHTKAENWARKNFTIKWQAMNKENILLLITQAKQTLEVLDESKGNNSTFIKNRVLGILNDALKELEEE